MIRLIESEFSANTSKNELIKHAFDLMNKAKETNDAEYAWDLVDFLYDFNILKDKLSKESKGSSSEFIAKRAYIDHNGDVTLKCYDKEFDEYFDKYVGKPGSADAKKVLSLLPRDTTIDVPDEVMDQLYKLTKISKESFDNGIVPDDPNDDHKPWRYKGFKVKWDKENSEWKIFNRDGDEEWTAESRKECKDFIDSY